MLEYLIVGLIVLAATIYTLKKYLPRSLRERLFGKTADTGCDSGCANCASGCDTPAASAAGEQRVIKLHSR